MLGLVTTGDHHLYNLKQITFDQSPTVRKVNDVEPPVGHGHSAIIVQLYE